ncbi:S8 family serine peptidase [Halorussus salilacus]|uniref:S8 family serine peptidase n=1 Tax=Halorussus salilacus TaxID=2953750 RepID=UPI00209EB004|nr:S8 family serine peptidase [Halorussus salilacus]USZ67914.1 S8 family serine peptidase [Halorussus salilacus]
MNPEHRASRRRVLRATGGALAGVGAGGLASAAPDDRVTVNVGFASERGRNAALDAADETVREFAFDAATLRLPAEAAAALGERPGVRYVERDGPVEALGQTVPWGVRAIDARTAHVEGYTGAGADVAVIDSGIDASHGDLWENLGDGHAVVDCDDGCNSCGLCETAWDDDSGHGTRIAGTVGAVDNDRGIVGVAPDATLHAVKVLGCDDRGSFSTVASGIQHAADAGRDVGVLALGAESGSQTLKDACRYAADRGLLLVGAAGNDGCDDCVSYPAAYDEVVAVSATDENDALASFSSAGPEIELAAPGADLTPLSCGGDTGYESVSGTSFAAAHVAGSAACLMAEGDDADEARARLRETAKDIGLPSDEQGDGLVDAAAALGL